MGRFPSPRLLVLDPCSPFPIPCTPIPKPVPTKKPATRIDLDEVNRCGRLLRSTIIQFMKDMILLFGASVKKFFWPLHQELKRVQSRMQRHGRDPPFPRKREPRGCQKPTLFQRHRMPRRPVYAPELHPNMH